MNYINTTESIGTERATFNRKALSQETLILDYFKSMAGFQFTPSQILRNVFTAGVPLTSVRRALTCLTADGHLIKCTHQVVGPYGRPEFCWKLWHESEQDRLF